jgi:preprotein translocase subunit SecF
MWILHFLPDSLILLATNLLLLIGIAATVAGLFAHRIPVIWQYQLPFKIVGIALLALGVYFRGGYSVEMTWRERVAEVEAQLEEAKKESAKVNTVVETRVVTKTQVVKQKADTLIEYVDREIVKEVNNCPIPQEAIDVHNEAARMNRIIEQQRKGQK